MIETVDLSRRYRATDALPALDGLSLSIPEGSFTALVGPSGSGKSTLFNLVAGIDRPNGGRIAVAGTELTDLSNAALAQWRARSVGLLFQSFLLLPSLTAAENVMAPMEFTGAVPRRDRQVRALRLLDRLGLGPHAEKRPAQLSGGQQQRVALARALANDAPLLLADEPTGNLDSATGAEVLALLRSLAAEGRTVVMITHDATAAAVADRVVRLADGRLADEARVMA